MNQKPHTPIVTANAIWNPYKLYCYPAYIWNEPYTWNEQSANPKPNPLTLICWYNDSCWQVYEKNTSDIYVNFLGACTKDNARKAIALVEEQLYKE